MALEPYPKHPLVDPETGEVSVPWQQWFTQVIANVGAGAAGAVTSVYGRSGAVVANPNDYTWNQIDKSTSSLADLATRLHASLTDIGSYNHSTIDAHINDTALHFTSASIFSSFTTGSIFFKGASGLAEDNAHFFWDDTNKRLIISGDSETKFQFLEALSQLTFGSTNVASIRRSAGNINFVIDSGNGGLYLRSPFKIYLGDNTNVDVILATGGGNVGSGTGSPVAGFDAAKSVAFSGDISPSQITVQQDNYNPAGLSDASVMRLSTDASQDMTGLQGGSDGRILFLHNIGSFDIVLTNEDANSSAANRFNLNADVTIQASNLVILQYDSTSSRWRAVAGGGGGGGTGLFELVDDVQLITPGDINTLGFKAKAMVSDGGDTIPQSDFDSSTDVNTSTDVITATAHPWSTGQKVRLLEGTTLPSPLAVDTDYYIIDDGTNTIQLATSVANAQAGTQIDITTTGTGIHSVVPPTGTGFLHTPTGRKILYRYDGADWLTSAIILLGDMTVYVDNTDGEDSINQGTAVDSDAFKTPEYAKNVIPGLVGGNVLILLNGETYILTSKIEVFGKNFTGAYTITFLGTDGTTSESGTATSGAQGGGNGSAGYGILTNTGAAMTPSSEQGKIFEITAGTGAGQIFIVHDNTATIFTVTGRWDTIPDATSVYKTYGWATVIDGNSNAIDIGFNIKGGQQGIILQKLHIQDFGTADKEGGVLVQDVGKAKALQCKITGCDFWGFSTIDGGIGDIDTCLCEDNDIASIFADKASSITQVKRTRIIRNTSGLWGMGCSSVSTIWNIYETYIDGLSNGILSQIQGVAIMDAYLEINNSSSNGLSAVSSGYIHANALFGARSTILIQNGGAWGALATTGANMIAVSGVTYNANTSGTRSPTTALPGGTT